MTRLDIAALITSRRDALNRHDGAALRRFFAEDCLVESPMAGRTIRGLAAIDEIQRAWDAGFPDITFRTDDLLIEGDRIAWIVTVAGTHSGGFMGLPATHRQFDMPMALFSTLRDGIIVSERRVYDFTRMLVQIGILNARAASPIPPAVQPNPPASIAVGDARPDAPRRAAIASMLAAREQAWAARDVATITGQHADDCVMDSHLAGRISGTPAVAEVYGNWFKAFPDSRITSEEVVVDGARVAELATMSGTDTGGFLGLAPTRKPFKLRSAWLYTLRDSHFVHVRPIYDFTGMLVQIGLMKAKPE